jgi:hypothetical protein
MRNNLPQLAPGPNRTRAPTRRGARTGVCARPLRRILVYDARVTGGTARLAPPAPIPDIPPRSPLAFPQAMMEGLLAAAAFLVPWALSSTRLAAFAARKTGA